jgi:hypothetical protein
MQKDLYMPCSIKDNAIKIKIETIMQRASISYRDAYLVYDKWPNKLFIVKSVDDESGELVITVMINGVMLTVRSEYSDFTSKSGRVIGENILTAQKFQIINEPPRLTLKQEKINELVDDLIANGEVAFRKSHPDIDIDSVFLEGTFLKADYGTKCTKLTNWWWPTEILFLCDNLASKGIAYCSLNLSRSSDSVRKKSYKLDINPSPEEVAIAANHYSEKELEFISQNIDTLDLLDISEITGRSVPSLRMKCIEMNIVRPLKKNAPVTSTWSEQEDEFLINNVLELGYREVGFKLDRTHDAVHFRAKEIGSTIKELREIAAHKQRMLEVFPYG